MRKIPYLWLDVFADRPFAGNQLCVILDGSALTDDEMQAMARETNLSETTFVLPPARSGATYRCRIFTPGGELAFAGHPTLGTAAALALAGRVAGAHLVQETRYGLTPVELMYQDGQLDHAVMEAPPTSVVQEVAPELVARVLRIGADQIGPRGLRPAVIASGVKHLIIPVASPEVLSGISPDSAALTDLSRELGVIGAYPFAVLGQGEVHARARLFAPLYGIAEDPATGSAAAPLGAYLHRFGLMPSGSAAFWYEQGVEMGRPSRLWVEVLEDGARLRVGGKVRLVARGDFLLD